MKSGGDHLSISQEQAPGSLVEADSGLEPPAPPSPKMPAMAYLLFHRLGQAIWTRAVTALLLFRLRAVIASSRDHTELLLHLDPLSCKS